MNLAFCLFHYFPFGGLQRDFLSIAKACQQRGHTITVFVMNWEGMIPEGWIVSTIPTKGLTNHRKCFDYTRQLKKKLKEIQFDCVIGFNKMPGLDIYFAADGCYQAKVRREHNALYRLTTRYRAYLKLEKSVFDKNNRSQILILNENEKLNFNRLYKTPLDRFYLLPPHLDEDRIATPDANLISDELRDEFSVDHHDYLLLMVASDFKTKGLERGIRAIASLPKEMMAKLHFFILGEGQVLPYRALAKKLKIDHRVVFLGSREDVVRFYMAADMLLHPAHNENAGKVLLEALGCGLPVLTTDICGYAHHIQRAGAGLVLSSPFSQEELNRQLFFSLNSEKRRLQWGKNALSYVASTDFFSLVSTVVDKIENINHVNVT